MKLKTARIIVESFKGMNLRWKKALKGNLKSKGNEETISIASWAMLDKVLSSPRLQILSVIPKFKPRSIAQLAKVMKKDFKNVYADVKFLADLGLIELRRKGPRKTLVPTAKFNEIEFPLAA